MFTQIAKMLSKLSIASEYLTVDCEFSYVYKVLAVQELLFLLFFFFSLPALPNVALLRALSATVH